MFKKPFKVKSNTQLKTTERKTLKELVLQKFPSLTAADIDTILPKKEVAFCWKIVTALNKVVLVYTVQKRALFINVDGVFVPTVYLLWQYPQICITFTTSEYVITKISAGADLMLPGLIQKPASGEIFQSNQVAAINTNANKAHLAVGMTTMSSFEMQNATAGKCVIVYHFWGDKLCTMDDMPLIQPPALGSPLSQCRVENFDDFPPLGGLVIKEVVKPSNEEAKEEVMNDNETINPPEQIEDNKNEVTVEYVDNLLKKAFLTAIKYSKTLQLPMLTSTFYKNEMLSNCPENEPIDIKKSSYKKVGQFLKSMEKEGLIQIKEMKKGVETVEHINKEHEMYLNFYVDVNSRPKKPEVEDNTALQTNITESYVITQSVLPIFKQFGFNKGDSIQTADVRKYVTAYVKSNNYQDQENLRFVKVQGTVLENVCKHEKAVTWEDLIQKVINSMKSCFKVTTGQEATTSKGKIPPIKLTVQTRSGNKKVTIVDNLELYNIRVGEFAKECQHGVAASTSVSRPSGKKYDQLLIQGNQVLFTYNLLTEKYKIPKKYIQGLENAPKTKK